MDWVKAFCDKCDQVSNQAHRDFRSFALKVADLPVTERTASYKNELDQLVERSRQIEERHAGDFAGFDASNDFFAWQRIWLYAQQMETAAHKVYSDAAFYVSVRKAVRQIANLPYRLQKLPDEVGP